MTTWDHILSILEKSLSPGLFRVWIKPLRARCEKSTLTLIAPNEFVANWVRDKHFPKIREAAVQAYGQEPRLSIVVEKAEAVTAGAAAPVANALNPVSGQSSQYTMAPAPARPAPAPRAFPARSWRFSFDDFVVGPSNQLAYAASQCVCNNSDDAGQLLICSNPGLGKTHLVQAIGQNLVNHSNRSNPRVRYLTAEQFATRMVLALRTRDIDTFKAEFREHVDVLLMEDIHFLKGKEKIQAELLATIRDLRERGAKIAFTSSFLPREMQGIDSQLMSRMCSGFLAGIEKPDFETRHRIVQDKATRKFKCVVPYDVSELLAEKLTSDVRQLESCLQNLILKAKLLGREVCRDLAMEVIRNYQTDEVGPDLQRIISLVCKTFKISKREITSKSRKRGIVVARNTAFFLARQHTDLSLQQIGSEFNRRHSTVLKGITNIERELSAQTPLGNQIATTIDHLNL